MIETKRLFIIPLTYGQLIKYVQCDNSLERELGLKESRRVIPDALKEALGSTILPNVVNKNKNYFGQLFRKLRAAWSENYA
jgi:YesN/AraC family two-component response regulator